MKKILIIIIILAVSSFLGCKSSKSTSSAATNNNSSQGPFSTRQTAAQAEQKKPVDTNQTITINPDVKKNISKDTNSPELDPNNIKTAALEPNLIKTTDSDPNQIPVISEPNVSEPNAPNDIDLYSKYADLLNKYVDIAGKVDYQSLNRKRYNLRDLIQEFAALDPNTYKTWSNENKIAFWINIYNLQMLNIITSNYPIESDPFRTFFGWPPDSIRYIDKKVNGITKQKFLIMNAAYTLTEIEERFLAGQFDTPAAFFALYHGGNSGPPLLNKPYTGKNLYEQLDLQIKKVLANSKEYNIDKENKKVSLIAILEPSWYGKYFVKSFTTDKFFKDQRPPVAAVLNFLIKYFSEQEVNFLKLENYKVQFIGYDWRLNEQKPD